MILFWAAINVLSHLERSLNDIWNVKKSRSIWRKFSDYLTIMILSPVLVILASSVTVYIKTQVVTIVNEVTLLGGLSPLIYFLFKLLPFFIIWMLFSLIYLLMPNTKVRFKSGLLAGFIAGALYQILQHTYINFQFLIAKYNAIYGSFAALPLFLIWLHLSWMIVFFGAEISFAHQNIGTFEFDRESRLISFDMKKLLALMISHLAVKRFAEAKKPLTMAQMAARLEIPIRLVLRTVRELVEGNVLIEVESDEPEEPAYQPAVDSSLLSMNYIVRALESLGSDNIPIRQTRKTAALTASLERFKQTIDQSPDNLLLKDLK
jgi:membrane protein